MNLIKITTRNVIRFLPLFGLILLVGLAACAGGGEEVVGETAVSPPTILATVELEETAVKC